MFNQAYNPDPFGIMKSCSEVQQAWLQHPLELFSAVNDFCETASGINTQVIGRCLFNQELEDPAPVNIYDERFQDPIWNNNPVSGFIKEYYLHTTHWLGDLIYDTPGVDKRTARTASFWIRQILNAVSPTNFFWTNPIAIQEFVQTGGKSLQAGLGLLMHDLQHQNISMVNPSSFELGKNLATTPGEVVYRNSLVEIIQYKATTNEVFQQPIFIVTPWINKYYILDLTEKKSLVKFLVDKGFTVFITSWRNPDSEMRDISWEDYMFKGVLDGIETAKKITKQSTVHAVGYCIGGTALSSLMAWLNCNPKRKKNIPVESWTLLCSLVDFSNPGEIDIFISEDTVNFIENLMDKQGYLSGKEMEQSFRLLRSNSLIWQYVVSQYLLGKAPEAFDVLFWNTDSTRLPQKMHSFYLREFYLNNNLIKPNAIRFGDIPIDIRQIAQPLYCVGTEQDHITPWTQTFKICALVNATVRYALATSGHIVGVLSPPTNPPKRRYWVGDASGTTDAHAWCEKQEKILGSWWDDWTQWLGARSGDKIPARKIGNETYPSLGEAPGKYALEP